MKRFKWIGIVLAGLVALSVVRDFVIKAVLTTVASNVLGTPVRMSGFSLGLVNQSIRIRGLKIHNPRGFPSGTMVDIPSVYVRWRPMDLLSGKLHLSEVEFELKELVLVKNKEGKSNIDSLNVAQGEKKKEAEKPAKEMGLQIDLLHLNMGKVVQRDYTVGDTPSILVYEIGIKKTYKNIKSPQQLAALILAEPMKSAGIKGAAIYGAAALTGVGFIPVVAGSVLLGKDSTEGEFQGGYDRVYETVLAVLKKAGTIKKEDRTSGVITADLPEAGVRAVLERAPGGKIKVTVSARKMMLPKPEVAGGVLYQITQRLK